MPAQKKIETVEKLKEKMAQAKRYIRFMVYPVPCRRPFYMDRVAAAF